MDTIAKPEVPTWIHGGTGCYHVLRTKTVTSEKSGRVFGRYDVALCTGRQLGGAWGSTRTTELPKGAKLCARCVAREANESRQA